jgi:ABC-2 type transport system ATP-binding protein
MDPEARAATRSLLAELRAEGAAILLTTHELGDVERLADRIVVIASGRVAAAGTPAELIAGARTSLRFRLTADLSEDDRVVLTSLLGGALAVDGGRRYRLDAIPPDPGLIATLAGWCAQHGLTIVELRSEGISLEERYLELVGGDR